MGEKSIERRKAFARKMTDILNCGALNLAMALGYRTGLFDVLDALKIPLPVAVIAAKAGLSARYVKEWLGVMVSGGVVDLSADQAGQDLFYLPAEHGDLIARRAGNANLGVYTQEMPLLTACAMEAVYAGFHTGEGVSYDNYPKFQRFMAQLADAKHREVLVTRFLPGIDEGRLVEKLKAGIRVCDLGCAEGVAVMLMAEAFPASRFVGIDISEDALAQAATAARRKGLANVTFTRLDAAAIKDHPELAGTFDYVTAFDAIHDQTRPGEALKGVHGMLKPGGMFSMVDIAAGSRLADNKDLPMGPFLYAVSLMHCMPVGLVDGGTGLGMMWGREKAVAMIAAAGFKTVTVVDMADDPFNLHFWCRK